MHPSSGSSPESVPGQLSRHPYETQNMINNWQELSEYHGKLTHGKPPESCSNHHVRGHPSPETAAARDAAADGAALWNRTKECYGRYAPERKSEVPASLVQMFWQMPGNQLEDMALGEPMAPPFPPPSKPLPPLPSRQRATAQKLSPSRPARPTVQEELIGVPIIHTTTARRPLRMVTQRLESYVAEQVPQLESRSVSPLSPGYNYQLRTPSPVSPLFTPVPSSWPEKYPARPAQSVWKKYHNDAIYEQPEEDREEHKYHSLAMRDLIHMIDDDIKWNTTRST